MTSHSRSNPKPHVAVVGGGIAGLTAATFAARAGARVSLLESVSELGGRARVREDGGYRFNMGPHALYRNGPADAVLEELGVRLAGRRPDVSRGFGYCEGRLHVLPGGPISLLTTSLLGARDKLALGAMLARFPKLDPAPWFGRSVRDFTTETFRSPRLRQVFEALVRLSTYANAPESMSAGTAIAQVQGALGGGVRYLDGGWRSMVEALAAKARDAGVEIREGARVRAVEEGETLVCRLREDAAVSADAVVLALGPREANALVAGGRDPFLCEQAERSSPVRVACLDVGLSRLPNPRSPFAIGIDEPTYLSLHSQAAAGLAPEGGAVFHLARYLAPDEKPDRREVEAQLERHFDALQPGWRDCLVSKKLLLDVPAAHALPTAERGGVPGRPPVDSLEATRPGLVLAGDWVGPVGWLVDASFASGRDAGRSAVRIARARRRG
jgi:phytoene dehydrogenase-like protein